MAYDNLQLDKGLYSAQKGFTQALESADPSANYRGTAMEGLDAYERQLKRFGIRVSGAGSDRIEKFFQNSGTATLFPEYVARAVRQGMERADVLPSIVAATTLIDGNDYRSITNYTDPAQAPNALNNPVSEGDPLPPTMLKTKDQLVAMKKHGRKIDISYEAVKFHRLDLFTVMLRQLGAEIAKAILADAVTVLISGDGSPNTAASTVSKGGSAIAYADLLALWNSFDPFSMTTILASSAAAQQVLNLPEMRDGCAGLDFHGTGKLVTPLGAELIKSAAVPAGKIVALDKNCALELVKAGDIVTDYNKLIDCQLEAAAVSATVGFAKIFPKAAVVLQ